MVTMQLGRRTSNQQELLVLISHLSLSTSNQVKIQEIMASQVDGLQDPYLEVLYLATSEHLELYNKSIVGLPESDRYDLTRSKWTDFCQ